MSEIFAARRDRLREFLVQENISAFLTHNLINARYLTGFTGSHATVLIGTDPAEDIIFTDGRYGTQVQEQCPDLPAKIESLSVLKAIELLNERQVTSLGIEAEHITVAQLRSMSAAFTGEIKELSNTVEKLRMIKDAQEISLLSTACEISVQALTKFIQQPVIGYSEKELGRKLDGLMVDLGADGVAFETIMAAGPHSAIPHHRPSDRIIAAGDFLKIDFGALYRGYHADITRTFVIGTPQDWQQEIYQVVAQAQAESCEAIAVGKPYSELDGIARTIIHDAGYGDKFVHSLGHGIGLEIHEAPTLSAKSPTEVQINEVITIEPGVYLTDHGGVRIEDSVHVDATEIRILTNFSKELISLSS